MIIQAKNACVLTMAKGVVSSGAVPGRHGEHEVVAGSKIAEAAVLRVVDEQRHDVGAVLRA